MKKLLLSSEARGSEYIVWKGYFVTDEHRQVSWDGVSPLQVDLERIVDAAYKRLSHDVSVDDFRVREVRLMNYGGYYFFQVAFECLDWTTGGGPSDIYLDMDGRIIEPEVNRFQNEDELDRHLDAVHKRPPKPPKKSTTKKVQSGGSSGRRKKQSKNEPIDLEAAWQRIRDWHEEHTAPGMFQLAPPAKKAEIDRLEAAIGTEFPSDVRKSFQLHNGTKDSFVLWHGPVLSLDEILRKWKTYEEWQRTNDWGLQAPFEVIAPIKPVSWNPKRIPLTDNSGDHLMLDLDPAKSGHYGQILEHSHEVGPMKVVAASWSEWLQQLANDLEEGKYVYVEAEETVALPGMYD